jgi:hypothetical protein
VHNKYICVMDKRNACVEIKCLYIITVIITMCVI